MHCTSLNVTSNQCMGYNVHGCCLKGPFFTGCAIGYGNKSIIIISKFSAPTIAFLAFWLAKKLRLWANIRSFTSHGK